MLRRILGSIVAVVVYWMISVLYTPHTILLTSKVAGQQFEDTDAGFVLTSYLYQLVSGVGVAFSLGLLVLLAVIWYKPIRQFLATLAIIGTLLTAVQPSLVWAYAETGNKTEVRGIESDETAFMIPNFGKTTDQTQYRSEAYLNRPDIKVPGKFVMIPHEKLSGTGGSSGLAGALASDYWVSTSTLIKVKRSPYSRTWVQKGRGTNATVDESFPCQTAGGHNISKIGVAVGVSIDDAHAAKYLAYFGLKPVEGDTDDLKTIFTSVRFARLLTDVTDNVVHSQVQVFVCEDILKYADPLLASVAMKIIMDNVKTNTTAYLSNLGITLLFMGWADTWTFDDEVQFAINQKFIADQVGDRLDVLQRNAVINALEGIGAGARKQAPGLLLLPESILNLSKPNITPLAQ